MTLFPKWTSHFRAFADIELSQLVSKAPSGLVLITGQPRVPTSPLNLEMLPHFKLLPCDALCIHGLHGSDVVVLVELEGEVLVLYEMDPGVDEVVVFPSAEREPPLKCGHCFGEHGVR